MLRLTQSEVYFRVENLPPSFAFLYMNPNATGNIGNCERSSPGDNAVDRMYSLLLASQATGAEVTVSYCQHGSYGLVTTTGGYIDQRN